MADAERKRRRSVKYSAEGGVDRFLVGVDAKLARDVGVASPYRLAGIENCSRRVEKHRLEHQSFISGGCVSKSRRVRGTLAPIDAWGVSRPQCRYCRASIAATNDAARRGGHPCVRDAS